MGLVLCPPLPAPSPVHLSSVRMTGCLPTHHIACLDLVISFKYCEACAQCCSCRGTFSFKVSLPLTYISYICEDIGSVNFAMRVG